MSQAGAKDWDPGTYARFRDFRLRPALDLMAQIGAVPEGPVVDLGCGDGAVAAALAARFPGHPLIEQEMASIAEGRVPQGDILTAQDGAAEVYYGLGAALGQDAADGFGTIYLQLAMMLKPEFPLALIALANYIEGSGNYERAIEVYDRVPPSSPLAYSVAIARARDLADLDRTDEAVDALKKLSAAEPAKRDAAVALGDILRDAERFGVPVLYQFLINHIPVLYQFFPHPDISQ